MKSKLKHDYETVSKFINQLAEKRALKYLLEQNIDLKTAQFLVGACCNQLLDAKIQAIRDYEKFTDIVENSNDEILQSFLESHPEFRDLL
jgi:hypothetical protein